MQLVMTAACFIALTYWWVVPESPRWLLVNRRWQEAEKVVRNAAKLNGRKIPANWNFEQLATAISHEANQGAANRVSFFQIFKYPVLTMRAAILAFCWLTLALVYYGSIFDVTFFKGNKFVNNGISAATELPLNIVPIALLYWGRKKPLILTYVLAAAAFFAVPLVDNTSSDMLKLMLAVSGKGIIKMAFVLIYVLTSELYPTVMRNTGLAMSSCAGRVGAMSAQYIADISSLGDGFVRFVPMLIFGAFSLAAGFLALLLPETAGRKLPDHIQDAIDLGKKPRQVKDAKAP